MHPLQGLSLRHKLPLFLVGLTAVALLAAGALAWEQVRGAARETAAARVERTATELGEISRSGTAIRDSLIARVVTDPVVLAALRGQIDSAALADVLGELARPLDGTLPIELWSAERNLIFRSGTQPEDDAGPAPTLADQRLWGPFQQAGGETLYWVSYPVTVEGATRGWVAQRQRLGSRETAAALGSLLGNDLTLIVGNAEFDDWASFSGDTVPGPAPGYPLDSAFEMAGENGAALAAASRLEGTPFVLIGQIPLASIEAAPRAFLRRMSATGAVLLLAVFGLGFVLSRRLTAPLGELANAADAIAAGGYGRRVRAEGADELARLGAAFNAMSAQIARADEQLRHRLEEARAFAERLEEASVRAEEAREEAQAASRAKSDFLATMSHEIRTPINAVIGYTELLEQGIPDPPTEAQRGYLERIDRSSRLLITLVNDVLDFARIESGQLSVKEGRGSAEEAIQAARAALEPQAQLKEVELSAECERGALFEGDANRVQQILLNLLSNAVKFTPAGGSVRLRCAISPEGPPELPANGAWVRLDVEDTGIGIPEDQLERVFEPFVQADTGFTREHGGVGLGLAISRRLAELQGGGITVRSTEGKGSRFTLWLRSAGAKHPAPPVAV